MKEQAISQSETENDSESDDNNWKWTLYHLLKSTINCLLYYAIEYFLFKYILLTCDIFHINLLIALRDWSIKCVLQPSSLIYMCS